MEYNRQQIILACATALGAFDGFPSPPKKILKITTHPIVQWFLVYVLIWQGGAKQDSKLSIMITLFFYTLYHRPHAVLVFSLFDVSRLVYVERLNQIPGIR